MTQTYLAMDALLMLMDEPARSGCRQLLVEQRSRFQQAFGSSHNHQAWPSGYFDHIQEVLNIAVVLYNALAPLRPLPFSLSDALLVLYLHDIEKPWAYEADAQGRLRRKANFATKEAQQAFRLNLLQQYNIRLTPEQENGLRYAEGEIGAYSNQQRTMGPLAAFCHSCDVISARLWFDHPWPANDPWPGAGRQRE
jgi:hypothetical protein